MGTDDDFVLVRTTNDDYPFMNPQMKQTHHRYNQTYKGIKVEYAELLLHHKNNRIVSINGKLAEDLNINIVPTKTEEQALTSALNHLGSSNLYTWQDSTYESEYKNEYEDSNATTFPTGELLIAKINVNPDYSANEFRLAWKFNIISINPSIDVTIYVDAHTGNILRKVSNLQNGTAEVLSFGYGTDVYIDTRWRGGIHSHHVLRSDDPSAPKVWTKRAINIPFTSEIMPFGGYNYNNSHDNDDVWDVLRHVETTPHWIVTKAWHYYNDVFGRNSYDNMGSEM